MVRDFYIPALSAANRYDRAVGFFSSSVLIQISAGLDKLIENGGEARFVISPILDEQDIEAIKKGYELREIVLKRIEGTPIQGFNFFEKARLNYLARLVSEGRLKFKIAVVDDEGEVGIYHEKIGIIRDRVGNALSFTGSANESKTALKVNFESITVFKNWGEPFEKERVKEHSKDFEDLWNNTTNGLLVLDFPEAAKDNILRNRTEEFVSESVLQKWISGKRLPTPRSPNIPASKIPKDFQEKAIVAWNLNNNMGILAMATGTGKTITGLGAAVQLYKNKKSVFLLILCPYQFLVEQWCEDVVDFGFDPISCYSQSEDKNWLLRLRDQISQFNDGRINFACFIMTIATYQSDQVQRIIKKCKGNYLILADEAHHLGSGKIRQLLPNNFPNRLALSATIERKGDEEGTQAIIDYFDKIVFEYPLDLAIKNGVLVPYEYYPVPVYLSQDRLDECRRLSKDIAKKYSELGKDAENNKALDMLKLRRSRLLAGEPNKLLELRRIMDEESIADTKYNLFYCGATRTAMMAENSDDAEELRQLEAVALVVGSEPYSMRISKFTAEENRDQRSRIRDDFDKGEIDAIVAIRCLDEGFNIPKIERAFLLASSTNPKEYIQRRGRVLRKAPGKKKAYIYDFVVLPRELSSGSSLSDGELKIDRNLVKRELKRVTDFAALSENSKNGFDFINKIKTLYRLGYDPGVEGSLEEE